MEALASSVFTPKFPETYPQLNSTFTSIRPPNKQIGSLKICEVPHFPAFRALALAREVPGSGEGEDAKPLNDEFGLFSEDTLSLSQVYLYHCPAYMIYLCLKFCNLIFCLVPEKVSYSLDTCLGFLFSMYGQLGSH